MKKTFSTTIEGSLLDEFKRKCRSDGHKVNEVLEVLMAAYCREQIDVSYSYQITARAQK